MVYQYFLCVLFLSSTVHGQISLTILAPGYCGNTTKLTCSVTGTVSAAHTWTGPPAGSDIVINGVEVVARNKYSEEVSGNQFSLLISGTNVTTDKGDYTCTNGFDVSAPQTLECECMEGFAVSPDGSSMKIEVSEAYPNTIDLKSVFLSKEGQTGSSTINVTRDSLKPNGEYFHFVWKSSDGIGYGTYKYTVTIEAATEFVFSGRIEFGKTTTTTTTTSTTTPITITSSTTIMTASPTTAATTSSMPTTSTSISTSTTKMPVSSTVTASPTASSTVTSTKYTVQIPSTSRSDRDSDKAIVPMIIVVSVIGGILIVAILSIAFVMMCWKSCFTGRGHPKQYARKSDHRKQLGQAEYNARGRFFTTRQDHAMRGYYFYNGTYKNPLFYDPFENSSYMNNYYPNQKNSHDPKNMSSHEVYQCNYDRDYNWDLKDSY